MGASPEPEQPISPGDQTAPTDADGLLLDFVRDRDVTCPRCGYNLRNLTKPVCPECRHDLVLAVGLKKPRFGWFLVTITPGLFSAIAAALLLMPIMIVPLLGGGRATWRFVAVDAFGWLSGFAVLVLLKYRFVFLRQPQPTQRMWAAVAWGIHLAAFAVLMLLIFA